MSNTSDRDFHSEETGDPESRGQAQPLVFAHVSDPHLTTLEDLDPRELLNKRILGYLSWRRRRRMEHRPEVLDALSRDLHRVAPDHVTITGDLTQIGLPDECRQARKWLVSLGNPDWITVIPGNHDRYAPSRWAETVGLWSDYMCSDPGQPESVDTSTPDSLFPSIRKRGLVAFIGLSSSLPTAPLLATGSLGERQRRRFRQLLAEMRDRGLFRVVLIHHAPIPGSYKWRKRLVDGADFCSLVRGEGAELVLHGHTHRTLVNRLDTPAGHAPVMGIPSASALSPDDRRRARYCLYRVTPTKAGHALELSVRGYNPTEEEFETENDWAPFDQHFPP